MEKIYIVTAGDSFTDSHMPYITTDGQHTFGGIMDKFNNPKELCRPDYAFKYPYYLVYELWKNGVEFEYFNIGKGSAGNHVIVHRYKQKVNELLQKGVNPKNIYGTIQLSGLVRSTHPVYEIEFDLPNVDGAEWDYINNMNPTVSNYKDVLEAHILNLENIIQWNKDNNITHFNMFFGWAIFYEDELVKYELKERFELIDKNYFTYFDYKERIDVMKYNCAGVKQVLKTIFGFKEEYLIQSGKYGGMTEFVADKTDDSQKYYISHYDSHLNTYGNYKWYIEYFRKLYVKWGVLTENNLIEENEKLNKILNIIFKVNTDCFIDSYQYTQNDSDNNELKLKIKEQKYNKFFKNLL
jgi:hypothetical protein